MKREYTNAPRELARGVYLFDAVLAFCGRNDLLEYFRMVFRERREDLAIDLDI